MIMDGRNNRLLQFLRIDVPGKAEEIGHIVEHGSPRHHHLIVHHLQLHGRKFVRLLALVIIYGIQ